MSSLRLSWICLDLGRGTDRIGRVVAEFALHVDALTRHQRLARTVVHFKLDVVAHGVFGDSRQTADRQRIGAE